MEERVLTTCVWCGTGCGLYLRVRDGEVVGVLPSRAHPISRGRLCIKGWRAYGFARSPDRLKRPLIREGGRLREASWDEALSLVARRLLEIRERYGPKAIAVFGSAKCTNEDNYVLVRFARATLGTDNIDHCARLCHAPTVAGLARAFGSGAMTNSIDEIEKHPDVILITGSNTAEQHPVIASHIIRAQNRGAKLIVVDPRRTPMARLADLYLAQRPGTDVAWINGMVNVIVREGLWDEAFVREHTEAFDEAWESIKEYTPEVVERITGIPKDKLVEAARLYGRAKRAMIFYAMGITQHVSGTQNVLALANLAMVTGNVGRPGTGVNPLRGQNNVQGASDLAVAPGLLPGYQDPGDPEVRARFREAWGVEPPTWRGLPSTEVPDAILRGEIRALYVMGENPLLSHPDLEHTRRAFSSLEFMVVQDIFLTETGRLAHVVLPASAWPEKEGTFTNTDRRVQRVRAAVEPPGEARDDWWIIAEIARRMGDSYGFSSPEDVFNEMRRVMPIYAGITYRRLDQEFGIPWPCPSEDHPGTPILHRGGNFRRGRGKFHPTRHADPPELPDQEYPLYLSTGRVGFHWHTGTMSRRVPMLEREYPAPFVEISPEDAERYGIRDGERVRVVSRRGAVSMLAKITDDVPPGLLFTTFHYAEAPANALTVPALDPIAKIPELKVAAVRIERE